MDSQLSAQLELVTGLRAIESMLEVCQGHKCFDDMPEGAAVSNVLMMVINKVFNLAEDQAAILESMKRGGAL